MIALISIVQNRHKTNQKQAIGDYCNQAIYICQALSDFTKTITRTFAMPRKLECVAYCSVEFTAYFSKGQIKKRKNADFIRNKNNNLVMKRLLELNTRLNKQSSVGQITKIY